MFTTKAPALLDPSDTEAESRVALVVESLRQSGLRLTHQRLEVAKEVARSNNAHPDVETIYRGVQARVPTVSLDTIYRTLTALAKQGLIRRVSAGSGPTRYDANLAPHHHFVCTRCGLIQDVSSTLGEALWAPAEASHLGRVESIEIQLHGVCKTCAGKESLHGQEEGCGEYR